MSAVPASFPYGNRRKPTQAVRRHTRTERRSLGLDAVPRRTESAMADPHPPRLVLPFALRPNPHVSAVEQRLLAWARGHGLVRGEAAAERFAAARFATFAGYIHPNA